MFALLFFALFLALLFVSIRMAWQRGKTALTLFLGLLGSVPVFLLLVIAPLMYLPALQNNRPLMVALLVIGMLLYAAVMIYFIRRLAAKMKSEGSPS